MRRRLSVSLGPYFVMFIPSATYIQPFRFSVQFPMKRNLHDKPQSASSSPTQSPKTPRPSKLVAPTTIQSGPEPTGARGNITRKSPVPATSALSSPRYRVDVPILPESQPVGDKKLVVRRKEGDKK